MTKKSSGKPRLRERSLAPLLRFLRISSILLFSSPPPPLPLGLPLSVSSSSRPPLTRPHRRERDEALRKNTLITMTRDQNMLLRAALMLLLSGLAIASGSTFISADVLRSSQGSTGRTLLQAKKSCSIDFESLNYTIVTSKCKGPQYPAKSCCEALMELACPYSEEINDLTNDCASTMFSYINLYGKYPPGLFANECRDSKRGLECPGEKQSSSSRQVNFSFFTLIISISGFIIAFLFA